MKHPVRIAAYIATFIIGIWGGNLLINQISNKSEDSRVTQKFTSRPAPEFNLPDIEGNVHNSHEWDGKVVVLNFWATWCPPCIRETPAFVELQEQYGAAGVQFIGIAIDKKEAVQEFMDTYGVNYPMLIGETNAIKIAKSYGNRFGALPYTVIINRQGEIHLIQNGEMAHEKAEKNIKQLL